MSKQPWAITTCRVSSPEQMENKSLETQAKGVIQAAKDLDAFIPEDGQWSGSVSSKAGTNTKRRDLKEMLDYCKKHPQVKYLIVHEVDRFMRSVDELFYFEVRFREEVGVKIIYASQPELNTDDYKAKLFKALEAFKGEGSNVERQNKSINGQTAALKEGRWTFVPKPGYMRGYERGIPEIHPVRGPALKKVLIDIATHNLTPSQGLIELNNSRFMDGHAPYKMDKFRTIVTDPFYASILEVNKQVQVRNENGLHKPLISKAQHYELVRIMNSKKKNQAGPRKNGNPKYPGNNIVICELCLDKPNGRFVGFDHTNGKSGKVYEKYRCRSCGRYLTRDALHLALEAELRDNPISDVGIQALINALNFVWSREEGQNAHELQRIQNRIAYLEMNINTQVDAATDPKNESIKEEILNAIKRKKDEIAELRGEYESLQIKEDFNKELFLRFAFKFIQDIKSEFLSPSLSQEDRLRCKQVLFPAGFYVDANQKVYTPEKSPLITLLAIKKDAEASRKSQLVRVTRL